MSGWVGVWVAKCIAASITASCVFILHCDLFVGQSEGLQWDQCAGIRASGLCAQVGLVYGPLDGRWARSQLIVAQQACCK